MHIAILSFISLLCQEPHPQFPPPTSLIVQGGSSKSMNDCQRHLGKTKSMKNRSKEECSPCFWSWDQHMLLLSHAFCEFIFVIINFQLLYVFTLLLLGCWFWVVKGRGLWWPEFWTERHIWLHRPSVRINKQFHNEKWHLQFWHYHLWTHHIHSPPTKLNGIYKSCELLALCSSCFNLFALPSLLTYRPVIILV